MGLDVTNQTTDVSRGVVIAIDAKKPPQFGIGIGFGDLDFSQTSLFLPTHRKRRPACSVGPGRSLALPPAPPVGDATWDTPLPATAPARGRSGLRQHKTPGNSSNAHMVTSKVSVHLTVLTMPCPLLLKPSHLKRCNHAIACASLPPLPPPNKSSDTQKPHRTACTRRPPPAIHPQAHHNDRASLCPYDKKKRCPRHAPISLPRRHDFQRKANNTCESNRNPWVKYPSPNDQWTPPSIAEYQKK